MKNTLLISVLFFLFSCATTYKTGSEGEKYKIPKDLSAFLSSFEKSVASHNIDKTLSCMDKQYKKEQLDGMLEGKSDQFLNEFFSGSNVDGSGFVSVKFKSITGIYFAGIQQSDNGYTVYYTVETKDAKADCNWDISVTKSESGTVYGLIGAFG